MLERDVEALLVRECRERGWLTMKAGQCGWPDRVIVTHDGRHYWVELKADTGRASKLQIQRIEALVSHGADARVVYGREGVFDFIRSVENEQKG